MIVDIRTPLNMIEARTLPSLHKTGIAALDVLERRLLHNARKATDRRDAECVIVDAYANDERAEFHFTY